MKFFSIDGGFYKFMTTFKDVILLNFCWLLCSLPIITMGAATVAAYSVTLKMVDEREGYVAKEFFHAFKENLIQGSILGVLALIATYGLWFNFANFQVMGENASVVLLIVGIIGTFVVTFSLLFSFPLVARYENTIPNILRNSFNISLRFFIRTLALLVVLVFELLIIFYNVTTIFLGILIGPICIMYTISGFALYMFRVIEKDNE